MPNKTELAALEKVFAAEISNGLPFQSKAKIYAKLENDGLLERATHVVGAGERFPVTVTGYMLTHAGRMAYCESCRDEPEP